MLNSINSVSRLRLWQRSVSSLSEMSNYQFLQRSKLPTFYFQKSLPRLPIPKLELTIHRLLAALEPILEKHVYENTLHILSDFRTGDGAELHNLLQRYDAFNKHTSYISQPWFDMYLSDRSPLPLNYNPVLIMKHETRREYQNQLLRATNLVISSMRFWRSLQAELLEPEVYHINKNSNTECFRNVMRLVPQGVATYAAYAFKAFPLDMSQYNRLFGVTRIPKKGKDTLIQYKDSNHILVLRSGNLYSLDVLDEGGKLEKPAIIYGRLQTILIMDKLSGDSKIPVGTLTSINRDEWAEVRQYLSNNICKENKRILEREIDAALFCLCLDAPDDPVYNEEHYVPLLKHLLVGEGKNRWFDKSVSLIVSADGTATISFEHSWGDGVAVLRYFDEIYEDSIRNPFANPGIVSVSSDTSKHVRPLLIKTDHFIATVVEKAQLNNKYLLDKLNIDIVKCTKINKELCKSHSISPDAIMQLSFQLAYRRAFNDYVGTYESCSTAAFQHGRTETIRPCTMATKQVCESLLTPSGMGPDFSEIYSSVKLSSQVHNRLTKEAAMGQGFDRHMFALRHQAFVHGKQLPSIYTSEAYAKINRNVISTSTLSSDALLAGSFGPVVQDGLGIAYSIQNDYCGAIVSSYDKQKNGKEFAESLEMSFDDIYKVLKTKQKMS